MICVICENHWHQANKINELFASRKRILDKINKENRCKNIYFTGNTKTEILIITLKRKATPTAFTRKEETEKDLCKKVF